MARAGDAGRPLVKVDLRAGFAAAAAAGRGSVGVVLEMLRLALGPGRLTPHEYLYYGLWRSGSAMAEKRRFVGLAAQNAIFARLTDPLAVALAHDKLAFWAFMRTLELPTPPILALCHPTRGAGSLPVLRSAAALAAWLRRNAVWPCVLKPVRGMFSDGFRALEGYDPVSDRLLLGHDLRMPVDELTAGLDLFGLGGWLIQPRLRPHPGIARLCGERLATLRLVVALEGGRPRLWKALWKVPAGSNAADNFRHPDNLLCLLDPEEGRVLRAMRSRPAGPEEAICHPDSGLRLPGFVVPGFAAAVETALEAAPAHDWLRLQAWDVAVTDRRIELLELNVGGDVTLPQLAEGRGFRDPALEALAGGARPPHPSGAAGRSPPLPRPAAP